MIHESAIINLDPTVIATTVSGDMVDGGYRLEVLAPTPGGGGGDCFFGNGLHYRSIARSVARGSSHCGHGIGERLGLFDHRNTASSRPLNIGEYRRFMDMFWMGNDGPDIFKTPGGGATDYRWNRGMAKLSRPGNVVTLDIQQLPIGGGDSVGGHVSDHDMDHLDRSCTESVDTWRPERR